MEVPQVIPARAVEAGIISEVLAQHKLKSIGSCSCGEKAYGPRMTREEVAHEHAIHVEKLLIDAGYIAASVHVDPSSMTRPKYEGQIND